MGCCSRRNYANDLSDPRTLIAVSSSANRSKGDKDPAKWMPPNKKFHCEYVRAWVSVKARWQLTMDTQERRAIKRLQASCPPAFPLQPLFESLFLPVPVGN